MPRFNKLLWLLKNNAPYNTDYSEKISKLIFLKKTTFDDQDYKIIEKFYSF